MLNKFGRFNQPNRIGSFFGMGGVTPLKKTPSWTFSLEWNWYSVVMTVD